MTNPRHNPNPSEALFLAKSLEQVKQLVAEGADIATRNKKGATLLFCAARKGDRDLVSYLITCGAKVDIVNNNGLPLALSVGYSHDPDIVDDLVQMGMDPFLCDTSGRTALMVATYPRMCRRLLDLGLDPNARTHKGQNALHCLVASKNHALSLSVPLIIAAGCDVNAQDEDGITPLMATYKKDSCHILVEAGADATLVDHQGRNVLHHLMDSPYQIPPKTVEMLILSGADPLLPDHNGVSAMDMFTSERGARLLMGAANIRAVITMAQRQVLDRQSEIPSATTPRSRL